MCNLMDPRLVGFAHDIQNMVPPMLKNIENMHILNMKYAKHDTPPFDFCMPHAKPGTPAMLRSSLVCKVQGPGGHRFACDQKMRLRSKFDDIIFTKKNIILAPGKMCKVDNVFAMLTIFVHISVSARGPLG